LAIELNYQENFCFTAHKKKQNQPTVIQIKTEIWKHCHN